MSSVELRTGTALLGVVVSFPWMILEFGSVVDTLTLLVVVRLGCPVVEWWRSVVLLGWETLEDDSRLAKEEGTFL